jgi:hypothetical protein
LKAVNHFQGFVRLLHSWTIRRQTPSHVCIIGRYFYIKKLCTFFKTKMLIRDNFQDGPQFRHKFKIKLAD